MKRKEILGISVALALVTLGVYCIYQYCPWTECGPVLHEPATVTDTIYTPPASHHRSGLRPHTYYSGLDDEWKTEMRYESWTDHTPAVYGVVFKCEHGQFVSQGSDDRHKNLWSRLPKYSVVDVTYREVHRVYRDGRREIVGLDFLDAVVTAKQGPAEGDTK